MMLRAWAAKWGIPMAAVIELEQEWGQLGTVNAPLGEPSTGAPGSETRQQALILLDGARSGVWLTRNNVGALKDARGIPVRYGLANESPERNRLIKSGDLIGIKPILVTHSHVGSIIGQFVSREAKHEGWQYTGTDHEQAQLNWVNFINSKGGDAKFATGPGSFKE